MTNPDDPTNDRDDADAADTPMNPGDEAPAGSPATGETLCPRCNGSGRDGGGPCPDCDGTGKVVGAIGGGGRRLRPRRQAVGIRRRPTPRAVDKSIRRRPKRCRARTSNNPCHRPSIPTSRPTASGLRTRTTATFQENA